MSLNKTIVDNLSLGNMTVDVMYLNEVHFHRMILDKLSLDKMTNVEMPLNKMSIKMTIDKMP